MAILVGALLGAVALPLVSDYSLKQRLVSSMSGSRQLYIAAFSMATDYHTGGDDRLGWPGDLAERKRDPVRSVTPYLERLMECEYLKKPDMAAILKIAGGVPWNTSEPLDGARHCPFKIYRVTETDGPSQLFCATRNFTYGVGLDAGTRPHGDKGFTIFRKGGDGSVFKDKKQAIGNLNAIGLLPGRTDFSVRNTETPDDYLLQR